MYRTLVVLAVSALLLALLLFVETVVTAHYTVGADLGWFINAPGLGLIVSWPWLLVATDAAVLLSLAAILVALGLALWAGDWLWIWGLGLMLPLGLFGWLAVGYGPMAGATLIFLPPVVAGAFGWQGMMRRRRTASNRPVL